MAHSVERLRSPRDFERVWRDGRSHAHPLVVLIVCPQPGDRLSGRTRWGFVAGRRLGGAVARNRAKRLLRAAAFQLAPAVADNWDLVWVARPPLVAASWAQTLKAMEGLLRHAGVWKQCPTTNSSS